ncbi:DUF4198 domain-containing protein [Actinobacillus pleuropneumoniae]|uniref:DUF4198 domain-containing protein n=1 Tax=Actinobacillus pleuropneumoniae TaxID=715 RepID=UPI00223CA2BC|nr:DUF4198 domain-containing protein [Actinobacillus pleuropneumoniae]
MRFAKMTILLSGFLMTSFVQAHNVWLEPTKNKDEYVVKFGHETTESYPEHKLKSIQLLKSDGSLEAATYQFQNGEAYFKADVYPIVFLQFDNGVWSKLPSGKYIEKTKKEAPSAVLSLNPVKLGKAILTWNEQATKSHNMDYELVPQAKPEAGKPLSVLVLHKGKPVSGIKVGSGEDKPFELTNVQGIAQFTPVAGFNKVWAEFEEKGVEHPDYTERSIEYMLTFDVK